MTAISHITVCICTYKRSEMLRQLLLKLEDQKTGALFKYSIVIVDNDRLESARQIVEFSSREMQTSVSYFVEPEQNIALARNKAIENAKGDFIAFIDDDEFPQEDWLLNLYRAIRKFCTDGVLGPVMPFFEKDPPQWIINGKFCHRETFATGTIFKNANNTRTGNVLFDKKIFADRENVFNPIFGKTGGEDCDFFRRTIKKGFVFAWCNEAVVYEIVSGQRMNRAYFIKRALVQGIAFSNSTKLSFRSFDGFKSIIAITIYTLMLPVLILIRHDLFMKYLIKDCDHLGKLLSLCGLKIVKERGF